jgi:hypothetical protein
VQCTSGILCNHFLLLVEDKNYGVGVGSTLAIALFFEVKN